MGKVRINDLARELEVKSKAILDALPEVGVTEKKTHSSSLEDHEADKVRAHFRASGEAAGAGKSSRASRPDADGIKTKIDLSHISKPGDVLKAIIGKQQASAPPQAASPPRPAPSVPEVKPPAASVAKPSVPAAPVSTPPPRAVTPPAPPKPMAPAVAVPTVTPPAAVTPPPATSQTVSNPPTTPAHITRPQPP